MGIIVGSFFTFGIPNRVMVFFSWTKVYEVEDALDYCFLILKMLNKTI